MPWPLPALLTWALAWGVFHVEHALDLPGWVALTTATGVGVALSRWASTMWRKGMVALGFPLSFLALYGGDWPAWWWLLPLLALMLVYPLHAWRDAPVFPTPIRALSGVPAIAPLATGAWVLDGGCGLGHGLRALRRAYPDARFHGVEWSWLLRVLCALRCPWARVRQGDLWRTDWQPYAMVYLFQRPESMDHAAVKAAQELAPGAWLVSLEFPATALVPQGRATAPDGRTVWIYQAPLQRVAMGSAEG
jgi:hypothetical protein